MNNAKKILVIDDDPDIREIIKIILDDEGFTVSELDNGHQVDSAVAEWLPDLILLDVMLGDMNGLDICRELKADKATASIPIIIVSATHNRFSSEQKDCHADDYLPKPFDIIDLVNKVKFYSAA